MTNKNANTFLEPPSLSTINKPPLAPKHKQTED